jgi:hypothetical protein
MLARAPRASESAIWLFLDFFISWFMTASDRHGVGGSSIRLFRTDLLGGTPIYALHSRRVALLLVDGSRFQLLDPGFCPPGQAKKGNC